MRQYSSTKNSGIPYIGEIPHHWERSKVKFLANYINGAAFKPDEWKEAHEDGRPIIRIQNLTEGESLYNYFNGVKADKYKVKDGDFLISWSASLGFYIWKGKDAWLNQHIFKVDKISKLVAKGYYRWMATWYIAQMSHNTHGSTMVHLTKDAFGSFVLFIPSIPEQNTIVRFLDYKTGQIDCFIANRQKQIELLKEQLHFKINQAITKGINSKTKFKQTDIKYVPEIPEHWDIRKFKSLTSILTCGVAATPEYVDESEGVAFLSAQNCRPFAMDLSKYNYIKPALHKQLTRYKKPQKGDVLVTRVGAGIGQACIINTDLEFSVYVSLTHIRPNKEMLSEYIVYFFNTEYCYQLNHEGTVVAGGQGNLNVKNVERYRIPLPPIEEQKQIIAYLDNYRLEMDTLISKYQKQIDLMQEYRTALISQAVTGKIDVREWEPKIQQSV
jgi:type I restriction enzyme S subunit